MLLTDVLMQNFISTASQPLSNTLYLLWIWDTWLTKRLASVNTWTLLQSMSFLQFWKQELIHVSYRKGSLLGDFWLCPVTVINKTQGRTLGTPRSHLQIILTRMLLFLVPTKINNRMTFNLKPKPINYLFCWKCWYLICLENFSDE